MQRAFPRSEEAAFFISPWPLCFCGLCLLLFRLIKCGVPGCWCFIRVIFYLLALNDRPDLFPVSRNERLICKAPMENGVFSVRPSGFTADETSALDVPEKLGFTTEVAFHFIWWGVFSESSYSSILSWNCIEENYLFWETECLCIRQGTKLTFTTWLLIQQSTFVKVCILPRFWTRWVCL